MQAIASVRLGIETQHLPVLEHPFFLWHAGFAIFSCAALMISAIYAFLYLLLFKSLKTGKFGRAFKGFPSLEKLGQMSDQTGMIGFILLTVAICLGYFWKGSVFESFLYTDAKIIITMLAWIVYFFKEILPVKPLRKIWVGLTGFFLLLLSMGLGTVFTQFHQFI